MYVKDTYLKISRKLAKFLLYPPTPPFLSFGDKVLLDSELMSLSGLQAFLMSNSL